MAQKMSVILHLRLPPFQAATLPGLPTGCQIPDKSDLGFLFALSASFAFLR